MPSPTERFADVLVIFEGSRRIAWHPLGNGCSTPTAVWPDTSQQAALEQHLQANLPALIILDHDPDAEPVPLLPEEASAVPSDLRQLVTPDGDLWQLRLPRLQWLPAHLREAGQDFLRESIAQAGIIPAPLLPDLLVDSAIGGSVRFAWRTKPSPLPDQRLQDVTRYLFAPSQATAPTTSRSVA